MNYFTNIKNLNESDIKFQLENNKENKIPLKVSLINALRRIILTDIPVISISESNTHFDLNTSMLNNGILSHRLNLVSIINSNFIKENYENINIKLKMLNETDDMITYYLKDCHIENVSNSKKIEPNKIFKYPNTPIGNIKPGQSVIMNTKLIKSTVRETNNASFCPVGTCVYYFDYDKSNKSDNKERFYLKDSIGNPLIYNFSIESSGQYNPYEIFELSINILINKLNIIKNDLVNKSGIKVILSQSQTVMKAVDLKIIDENDTLGNLIVQYISLIDKINYCAYDIVHPLVNNLILRISYGNNTFSEISELVVKTVDFLIDFLNKLKQEWVKKTPKK